MHGQSPPFCAKLHPNGHGPATRGAFRIGDLHVAKLLDTYKSLIRQLDKNDLSVVPELVSSGDYAFKLAKDAGFELHIRNDRSAIAERVLVVMDAGRIVSHEGAPDDAASKHPRRAALQAQGGELIWQAPEPAVQFDESDLDRVPALDLAEDPVSLTKMSRVYHISEDRLAESDHEAINDLIVCSAMAFAAPIDAPEASNMVVMFAGDPGEIEQIRIFLLDDDVTGFDWTREGGEYELEDMMELKDTATCIWLKGHPSVIAALNDRVEPTDPAMH